MSRWVSFRNTALIGYVVMILPLTAVKLVIVGRFSALPTQQAEHLRSEEVGIALAHHVRWNAELVVSAGRGYLLL
jgi:hypothetical protein